MNRYDILCEAISTYGEDAQTMMLFEEMSELQNAICKHKRGRDDRQHICEEIADVMVMLDQMSIIFGTDSVKRFYDLKLKRLKHRLNKEKAKEQ